MNNIVSIKYKSASGDNLLNPSTSGHYISKDVTLYKLQEGKKVKIPQIVYYGPDSSWNYQVDTSKGYKDEAYFLFIGISKDTGVKSDKKKGVDTILIRLQKGCPLDTLKAHYRRSNGFIVDTLWYNGQLKVKPKKKGWVTRLVFTVQKPGRSPADSTQ
jgi:hypothetical protein